MAKEKFVTRREYKEARRLMRRALNLQATEYERRLGQLNGEQGRIAEAAATAVRKDVYEQTRAGSDARIAALEAQENRRVGAMRLIGLLAAGGFLTGVLGLWQQVRTPTPAPQPQVYYVPAVPGTMVPSPQAPVQR